MGLRTQSRILDRTWILTFTYAFVDLFFAASVQLVSSCSILSMVSHIAAMYKIASGILHFEVWKPGSGICGHCFSVGSLTLESWNLAFQSPTVALLELETTKNCKLASKIVNLRTSNIPTKTLISQTELAPFRSSKLYPKFVKHRK